MMKRMFKIFLIFVMIMGFVFSISNFFPKKIGAIMTEEQLYYEEIPGGYAYWCDGPGGGCYTVELPQ